MLELHDVTKAFGPCVANAGVTLRVQPGTIHAIVGENGAGKSTAMKIAYGLYPPDGGEVCIDGAPRRLQSPHDAIALGVGMVHQHFMLVEPMTVAQNVVLGTEPGSPWRLDTAGADARIRDLSRELGLELDPRAIVETLAVGQQQRVELLKALYREAKLLILDEPTAVLSPQAVGDLFAVLRKMRAQGRTVVIVTHKLSEVLAISDEVTVMRDGRVVGERRTAETSAAELARLMVGRDVLLRVEKGPAHPGAVVLAVAGLSFDAGAGRQPLVDVSLEIRAGEIVGIAGIEGNGQSELVEALAGLVEATALRGRVVLGGEEISGLDVHQRRARGIAHVPEDRQRRGLLLDFDLAENTLLGVQDRPPVARGPLRGWIDRAALLTRATTIVRENDVRPPDLGAAARALSGGNQQKLVLGRELEAAPRLLLVAQPTRGVDIGGIERIHRTLVARRDQGTAILVVSSELEEVTALADRLLVMRGGRLVGEVDPRTATPEEIGLLMTGGARAA